MKILTVILVESIILFSVEANEVRRVRNLQEPIEIAEYEYSTRETDDYYTIPLLGKIDINGYVL